MTIGIITIHTGWNEGAVLQALALSRLIGEVTGEAVEILDHRYAKNLKSSEGPADTGRKRAIAAFRDANLPLSPERFEDDHRAAWGYAAKRYSAVVVGSDEVWKVVYRSRLRGFLKMQNDPLAPAYPNVWWPDETAGPVRIAYAATCGARTDWRLIPKRRQQQMADAVRGFRGLGLRDARTRAFLAALAPEAAARSVRVPDPTLGHDLLTEAPGDIRTRLAGLGVDFGRPRVVFVTGTDPRIDELAAILGAQGMQTVALSRKLSAVELDLSGAELGPLDWAAAFGAFDLAVSDRMHGCIFALRNGTPLIALDARRRTMGMATKNEEIAERFGIGDSYFPLREADLTAAMLAGAATRALSGDWPFEDVRRRLASEAEIARSFLRGVFQTSSTSEARR